jgi:Flp pilus assembly protein TadB
MVIAALVVAAVAVGAATAAIWVNMRTRRQMDHLRQQVAEALDAEQIMRRARKPGRGGFEVCV